MFVALYTYESIRAKYERFWTQCVCRHSSYCGGIRGAIKCLQFWGLCGLNNFQINFYNSLRHSSCRYPILFVNIWENIVYILFEMHSSNLGLFMLFFWFFFYREYNFVVFFYIKHFYFYLYLLLTQLNKIKFV